MKKNVCLVTFPIYKSGITPLSNYIDILLHLSPELYVITGNDAYSYFHNRSDFVLLNVTHNDKDGFLSKIFNYIWTQLKICRQLIRIRKDIDVCILFFGGHMLLLPVIVLKIFGKDTFLTFADYAVYEKKSLMSRLLYSVSRINIKLVDHIILYSKGLITVWGFEKYREKVIIAPRHFVDFNKFYITTSYNERSNLVGYIGRFAEEKGIMNLLEAIPLVIEKDDNIKFMIIGDGPLKNKVLKYVDDKNLVSNVRLMDWVDHDLLPDYLNTFKLTVIPSYTEGLPNIMLESMACGTPVLSTPVGSVPDIIEHGVNGFLVGNNEASVLARAIISSLGCDSIQSVISKAHEDVSVFSFDNAVKLYDNILSDG